MGASWGSPPTPEVDLLPPRFERVPRVVDLVSASPFVTLFGAQRRKQLLEAHVVRPGEALLRARLHPDLDERMLVEVEAGGNPLTGANSAAGVTLGVCNDDREDGMLKSASVSIGTRGSAIATISAFDTRNGVGGFAKLPLALDGSAGAAAAGTSSDAAAELPELGVRYASPEFGTGAVASPFSPYPAKLWVVGAYSGEGQREVTAGIQLSGLLATALERLTSKSNAAASSTRQSLVDVHAAVSVAQPPAYEVSLAVDGTRQELVAGYVHSMTLRRRVRNPLEATHVTGIWNYVDLGLELRRSLVAPFQSSLAVAAAWQANKNVLVKLRGGPDVAVSGTLAVRSLWDPSVAVSLTYTVRPDKMMLSPGSLGLFLSVEKGGQLEYRKAVAGAQSIGRSLPLRSVRLAEESGSGRADPVPYAPPPGASAAGKTRLLL